MASSRVVPIRKISLALALLCAFCAVAQRADSQRPRDVHLTVNAMVIAAAPRIQHAEVTAISSTSIGPQDREVQALVTAESSGESTLSILTRFDGVTVDIIGADGRLTPLGEAGVRVGRTTGGQEASVLVRLRLHSGNPELLGQAARSPVSLVVDSAVR